MKGKTTKLIENNTCVICKEGPVKILKADINVGKSISFDSTKIIDFIKSYTDESLWGFHFAFYVSWMGHGDSNPEITQVQKEKFQEAVDLFRKRPRKE